MGFELGFESRFQVRKPVLEPIPGPTPEPTPEPTRVRVGRCRRVWCDSGRGRHPKSPHNTKEHFVLIYCGALWGDGVWGLGGFPPPKGLNRGGFSRLMGLPLLLRQLDSVATQTVQFVLSLLPWIDSINKESLVSYVETRNRPLLTTASQNGNIPNK